MKTRHTLACNLSQCLHSVLCVAFGAALCLWALGLPGAPVLAAMPDEQFFELCAKGEPGEIRQALKDGANPNAKNEYGFTALMFSADNNGAEALKLLLDAGADVSPKNRYGRTALMLAAWNDNVPAVTVLLSAGADRDARDEDGLTALAGAAKDGKIGAVRALLSAGADAGVRDNEGHDALWHAKNPGEGVDRTESRAVLRLLEGDQGRAAMPEEEFAELCETGTEEQVQKALQDGADPAARKYYDWGSLPALTLAARAGKLPVVRALLQAGANTDDADVDVGVTALMAGAEGGHPEVVRELLAAGADPKLKDIDGHDALWHARQSGSKDKAAVVRLLEQAAKHR